MKARLFTVFVLVIGLALFLAWSAAAQGPTASDHRSSAYLPGREAGVDGQPVSRSAPTDGVTAQDVGAAVALGSPGTVYRYTQTFGETAVPYLVDVQHLNTPDGLFIDGSNNLYVVEQRGARLLEYRTSDGANVLSVGAAGVDNRGEYSFDNPKDVAVDGGSNIWVVDNHRAAQYDTSGNFLQEFPPEDPWQAGNDDTHFDTPYGIAFDSAGRMYISDHNNHRIQVYDFVGGSPVYSTTIGETGVSGGDASHFARPDRIAIDSLNRLYVADLDNYRVQRCTYASGWTCATFHGGSQGSGADQLDGIWGIAVDGSDNVYLSDSYNGRIKKCTSGGVCSVIVSDLTSPGDVAVDALGNVYVADYDDAVIRKYTNSGGSLGIFKGVNNTPYVTDDSHFYDLYGVAVDSGGNIYLGEDWGYRALKLNPAGVAQWTAGVAGTRGDDNLHFGDLWNGVRGVAVDAAGNVYALDAGNHRVQIYNSSGSYVTTLGSYGSANYQFDWPNGIAIGPNGNIYVADSNNQRVQIFNSSRVYQATLGVTGVSGDDNEHFSSPRGVAVDGSGNIYVADSDNNRMQIFNSSRVYQRTLGTTGEWGSDFGHLDGPRDVAVDAQGRIFVADTWNDRVQVFNRSGAYLTSLGGWGFNPGQVRAPASVDVDSAGNVYVADSGNGRVEKYSPGVPGWAQVNINGFGDRNNVMVHRMSVFSDYLYASTRNESAGGGVWRSTNGTTWSQVNEAGFGANSNTSALVGENLNGTLYVGTSNGAEGAEIWRCAACDGADWQRVVSGGFNDPDNSSLERIVVFSSTLYASTINYDTGAEVWKSSTGAPGSWTQANTDGFGDPTSTELWAAKVFSGYLYVGTASGTGGVEIWRTSNGTTWNQVNADNFGDTSNGGSWLESFHGYLYALVGNGDTGVQVWRCDACNAPGDWEQVAGNGFGDSHNTGAHFMLSSEDYLYASAGNDVTGGEIWRTTDGTTWNQTGVDGLGDSNNTWIGSGTVFNDHLYLGTSNWANGGEVWSMGGGQVYLPAVLKNR